MHLSRKTEVENIVLLSGFNETAAWEIHFWEYVCICASVYEREREGGNYSSTLRRQAIHFMGLSKAP